MAYFRPTGPTSGEYTYNNHIIEGPCDDSSYGTYAITFYTANEGDIVMTGPTTRTCGVVTVFDQITEIRIAIRRQ